MRLLLLMWLLAACSGASESESASESASAPESASESASESESASASASESESESESEQAEAEPQPEAGTLRYVVIPDGPELLGSEERQLDALRTGLGRGRSVDAGEPSDAERAWVEGGGALPASWARFETVVVLRIAEPRTLRRSGRRMSQGLRSVHVLRPPATEPAYHLEGGPVGLSAEKELAWLGAILGALDEGEAS